MATPLEGCMTFAVTAGKQLSGMSHSLLWSPPCVYMCVCVRACVCPTRKPILSGIPSTQPSLHSQGSTLSDATVGWKIHNWNNNSNFIFLSLSATDRFCVLYQCVSASKSLKASWEVYYDTVRMYLYRNIYMYIHINATAFTLSGFFYFSWMFTTLVWREISKKTHWMDCLCTDIIFLWPWWLPIMTFVVLSETSC